MNDLRKIRRGVLELLYELFRENPYDVKSVEEALNETGVTDTKKAEWNISYLEKKGLIRVSMIDTSYGQGRYCAITTEGIDLVEDVEEFNRKYPIDATLMADGFFDNLISKIEQSDLPDSDKESILKSLEHLSTHSVFPKYLQKTILELL